MKNTKYPELKNRLKTLAKELKEYKYKRNHWWDYKGCLQGQFHYEILKRKYECRHKHIAYCLLRGRKYEEIERTCRISPNWHEVDRIKGQYEQKTLCVSA